MSDPAARVRNANAAAIKRGVLSMWTLYDRPTDHPEGFIARRFEIRREQGPTATGDTLTGELDEIRKVLWGAGLMKLSREDGDEPQIVETWV
jgi:hypothetical protein